MELKSLKECYNSVDTDHLFQFHILCWITIGLRIKMSFNTRCRLHFPIKRHFVFMFLILDLFTGLVSSVVDLFLLVQTYLRSF